ncbi:MAG: hypothetical protein IJQ20_09825 [Paludibacteraceae bacterium]|nr:hypothetical protein [Paludibacteraceae bacterium]MBQ6985204.1 hypothetical protein [Paludibacteraceae bacterium]MBQ9426604.1 hypothetical protein [Paludibacteraceae bacterium]
METPFKNADIKNVEQEILRSSNSKMPNDKEQVKTLLHLRKSMLDGWARAHEKEFLPVIKEFNFATERALKDLYDLAHRYYEYMATFDSGIQLVASLRFTKTYPRHLPFQSADRAYLWNVLLEHGWNPLFQPGLTEVPLYFPYDSKKSFPLFVGSFEETGLLRWRGGGFFEDAQDDELEGYHFGSVFYHLAEHTCFALTDFIYVRDFETSIDIHWDEQKSYSRLKNE